MCIYIWTLFGTAYSKTTSAISKIESLQSRSSRKDSAIHSTQIVSKYQPNSQIFSKIDYTQSPKQQSKIWIPDWMSKSLCTSTDHLTQKFYAQRPIQKLTTTINSNVNCFKYSMLSNFGSHHAQVALFQYFFSQWSHRC